MEEMTMEMIEARLAEIRTEAEDEAITEARSVELSNEVDALETRRNEIIKDAEARAQEAQEVAEERSGEVIEEHNTTIVEEKKMFGRDSKEYRDAFYAMIAGNETAEQRTVLANPISVDGDGTDDGMAIAIPTTLDTKIWDNIHTNHPILADITTIASGIIMQVTKHTAITAGKAKKKYDGASNSTAELAEESNTFVKVNLVGHDYAKYITLTYAEAKMSQGAMEDYLAEEIAADLGEALAKDVFAQIVSDGSSNSTSKSNNGWFATLKTALGTVPHAQNPVVYVAAADYYDIYGSVDSNGQPIFRDGVALGAAIKIDSAVPAAVKAVVVDPKKFILNVIQGVMVETDKDIKEHRIVVSGYCRAEGCMRDNNAAGKIVQ